MNYVTTATRHLQNQCFLCTDFIFYQMKTNWSGGGGQNVIKTCIGICESSIFLASIFDGLMDLDPRHLVTLGIGQLVLQIACCVL